MNFKDEKPNIYRHEPLISILYFTAYFFVLFYTLENEAMHWVSLVIVPTMVLYAYRRFFNDNKSIVDQLKTFGLDRSNWKSGLLVSAVIGIILSTLQLVISRNSGKFVEIILNGKFLYLAPIAFIFLLVMTGFTEEFFFRGIVQTRLEKLTNSKWLSLAMSTVIFGLYHIPYAYLNPHWPSAGDFPYAVRLAMTDGALGGLVLGLIFIKSRYNLITVIIVHALIDLFPAMTMIKFGGQ